MLASPGLFPLGLLPRSLSWTVSVVERHLLGCSSGGYTAGQPFDDGCYVKKEALM